MPVRSNQEVLRVVGRVRATSVRRHLRLPVVEASAPASKAFRLMRRHKCSAVIAFRNGRSLLYTAPQVVFALSEDPSVLLADVPHLLVLKPRRSSSVSIGMGIVRPWAFASREMRALMLNRYGSSGRSLQIGYVLDADLARTLYASPQDCYCRVDHKPVPGGSSGSDCPYGHRGSVRCL